MNILKKISILVPSLTLLVGGVAFLANSSVKSSNMAQAADYSSSDRDFEVANDGSISTKFTVSETNLNMRGWLLCFFNVEPLTNNRKLDNSNNLHPYYVSECVHYFFAESKLAQGTINITWKADAADQKEAWTIGESTGAEKKTLKDYYDDQDWYFVIGPRHYNNEWHSEDKYGQGIQGIWENCDYLLGQRSALEAASKYAENVYGADDSFTIFDAEYYSHGGSTITGAALKTTALGTEDSGVATIKSVGYNDDDHAHIVFTFTDGDKKLAFDYQYGTAPYAFYLTGNGTVDLPYTFVPLHTAEQYASYFLSKTSFCNGYDGVTDNEDKLVNVWTELSRYYDLSLDTAKKAELSTSNNADIKAAMSRYDYVVDKYSLTNFIGRPPIVKKANSIGSVVMNDNATSIIAISVFSMGVVGMAILFLIKKKKA